MKLKDFGPTTRAEHDSSRALNPCCPKCLSWAITWRRDKAGVLVIACKEKVCGYAMECSDGGRSWDPHVNDQHPENRVRDWRARA